MTRSIRSGSRSVRRASCVSRNPRIAHASTARLKRKGSTRRACEPEVGRERSLGARRAGRPRGAVEPEREVVRGGTGTGVRTSRATRTSFDPRNQDVAGPRVAVHERPRLRVDDLDERRRIVRATTQSGSGSAAAFAEPRANARSSSRSRPNTSRNRSCSMPVAPCEQLVHRRQPLEGRGHRQARPARPGIFHQEPTRPGRATSVGIPTGRSAAASPNRNASRAVPSGVPTFATSPFPRRTRDDPSRVRSCRRRAQAHQDVGRQLGHRHRVRRALPSRMRAIRSRIPRSSRPRARSWSATVPYSRRTSRPTPIEVNRARSSGQRRR